MSKSAWQIVKENANKLTLIQNMLINNLSPDKIHAKIRAEMSDLYIKFIINKSEHTYAAEINLDYFNNNSVDDIVKYLCENVTEESDEYEL